MFESVINYDKLASNLDPYVREIAQEECTTAGHDGRSVAQADLDIAAEAMGYYPVGENHRHKTIQSAVDAAPEESGVETGDTYGESAYEPGATILITASYDSEACGEYDQFPVVIDKKRTDVIGYARAGACIKAPRDVPIFEVTGTGSYDYRNCRRFANFLTQGGDPVIKDNSDHGLVVRDVIMQGPQTGVDVWAGPDDHLDSVVNRFENVHIWWPHGHGMVFRGSAANNATHIQGCWIHGSGGERNVGTGIKLSGAACSVSQTVIEQVGGRAIEASGNTSLTLLSNYFEQNHLNRTSYPLDINLDGCYGFVAIGNYFNSGGVTMRGINARDVESPVILGNSFNNYANVEYQGDTGHAIGLHSKAPGAIIAGNVSHLDKGGTARARIVGMDHVSGTTTAMNNIGADGMDGNHSKGVETAGQEEQPSAMKLPKVDDRLAANEEGVSAAQKTAEQALTAAENALAKLSEVDTSGGSGN